MNVVDDEVGVLIQLHINETKKRIAKKEISSRQGIFSAQYITMAESRESNEEDHNSNNDVIERDLEFIRKHAAGADRDFLHSLLDSQKDNPKRLETVMLDILKIPNALELIAEFRGSREKKGKKRSASSTSSETEDIKKKRAVKMKSYFQKIKDIFPDADGLFLTRKCQQLESWEDYSRFIDTVMIAGLYPKKGAVDVSPVRRPTEVIGTVNDKKHALVEIISSEEEISSSDSSASPKRQKRRRTLRKRRDLSGEGQKESHDKSLSSGIEIVDLASDQSLSADFETTGVSDNSDDSDGKDDKDGSDGKDDKDGSDGKDDKDGSDGKDDKDDGDGKDDKDDGDGKDDKDDSDGKVDRDDSDGKDDTDDSDGKDDTDDSDGKDDTDDSDGKDDTDDSDGEDDRDDSDGKDDRDESDGKDDTDDSDGEDDTDDSDGKDDRDDSDGKDDTDDSDGKDDTDDSDGRDDTDDSDGRDDKDASDGREDRDDSDDVMEVKQEIPTRSQAWGTNLVEDIHNLLHKKFPASICNADFSEAGPSGLSNRPRSLLPGRASTNPKRSQKRAEITETKKENGNGSPDSSTSETIQRLLQLAREEYSIKDPSKPEVPTTSNFSEKKDMENETALAEEKEEATPKVSEEWVNEQTCNLIQIFPSTDPSYLRDVVQKINGSVEAVNDFVNSKMEMNDMPTRAEYEKRKEMEELQNRYTKNFSIEEFLKAIPDPWAYFSDRNRDCTKYKNHSLCFLRSAFRSHFVKDIAEAFKDRDFNLYLTYCDLKEKLGKRGRRRSDFECNSNRPTTIDIQFLQEAAFIQNEEKIKDYIEEAKRVRNLKFETAKREGSLLECKCCFENEILVDDIVYCPKDHPFCKNCIIKSVEVEMGKGACQFECLSVCNEKFTLPSLQNVLKPELFSKVIQAIQVEEIRAAGIEDLVQCPFCNYATIMPPEVKVMICLNPECLRESCRMCKELNHIPLRCDEVEKSDEVKMRTYIENKMTEALVRTCYKCEKKFVKEDGCNKMTCTCGANMCYVCRKPITSYSHFNGQGGTEYLKCPLYSHNDELHVDLVRAVGEEAKAEILQANPNAKLLHDPTVIMPQKTNEDTVPGTNNGAALALALRAVRGTSNQQQEENEDDDTEQRPQRGFPRRDNQNFGVPEIVLIDDSDDDSEDEDNFARLALEREFDFLDVRGYRDNRCQCVYHLSD